jgi:hypothetical protein
MRRKQVTVATILVHGLQNHPALKAHISSRLPLTTRKQTASISLINFLSFLMPIKEK